MLHCQCAFWGLSENYESIISINAETGASKILSNLPADVAFSGGAQCVADPVNKILYFSGSSLENQRVVATVYGADLNTGEIVSSTSLPTPNGCCTMYLTFIAENQLLVVTMREDDEDYIVSMVYVDTNEVVELTTWPNPQLIHLGVGPGVYDSVNQVS